MQLIIPLLPAPFFFLRCAGALFGSRATIFTDFQATVKPILPTFQVSSRCLVYIIGEKVFRLSVSVYIIKSSFGDGTWGVVYIIGIVYIIGVYIIRC